MCCEPGAAWDNAICQDSCASGHQLACDDTADCPASEVCCANSGLGTSVLKAYCAKTCAADEARLCSNSNECGGLSCTPITTVCACSPTWLSECR